MSSAQPRAREREPKDRKAGEHANTILSPVTIDEED